MILSLNCVVKLAVRRIQLSLSISLALG